jgi:hypothetical protein
MIFTSSSITENTEPVLFAYRTPENDLFLFGKNVINDPEDLIRDVSFHTLLKSDESLKTIADLPSGSRAYRKNIHANWKIAQVDLKTGMGDYLDGHLEWVNKMYVDGYFTGGVVPKWLSFPGKPKLFGWVSIFIGILLAGAWCVVYFSGKKKEATDFLPSLIFGLMFLFIGLSLLIRNAGTK